MLSSWSSIPFDSSYSRRNPIEEILNNFGQILPSEFGNVGTQFGDQTLLPRGAPHKHMPMDVIETDTEFIVFCELPGVKKEQIDVETRNHLLTIQCDKVKCCEETIPGCNLIRNERMYGLHKRKYKLPDNLDESTAVCEYTDGILKVVLKKIGEQGIARKLQIK